MTLVIASQLSEELNAILRDHPSKPEIVVPPADAPWTVADRADAFLVWPTPAWRGQPERPEAWPGKLRWVQSATAGIDYYPNWLLDVPAVTCARGVASDEMAEYVMAAIYAAAKPLHALAPAGPEQWVSTGTQGIAGRTVGIIGYGSIGQAVARRALGNDMQVVALRRSAQPADDPRVRILDDAAAIFEAADHIVLALPETPETRGLVDAKLLARARPGAHLINVGRGSAIDHDALLAALDAGTLGFATLDVTQPEPLPPGSRFYTHPNVRLTPHIASNFRVVQPRLKSLLLHNLERLLAGEPPLGLVDRQLGY